MKKPLNLISLNLKSWNIFQSRLWKQFWLKKDFWKPSSSILCLILKPPIHPRHLLLKRWSRVFLPLTGNSFIKSYKCKTGPASKFLINGRSKSCTCFEQCLSWAACHMTLIWSLVIFPSTAKKLRSTWHCFMTSTCKFGPKINSTIFWVKIQPKSWKKSKYKLL